MSNYKVEFTLKQHTPIIHFQSDQSGATLRATELKPKFDRFLKKYAFDGNVPDELKIDKSNDALDYKVKINIKNLHKEPITPKILKMNKGTNKEEIKEDNFPCFFATMGKEWKKSPKYFSYAEGITVSIVSMNDTLDNKLIKQIKNYFPRFIFETNFGTRQSKGFGSFSVIKVDNKTFNYQDLKYQSFEVDVEKIDKKIFPYVKYENEPSNEFKVQKKLFTVIDIFYKTIRSGINLRGQFYFKSLLFLYAKKEGIQWDKKTLKHKFVSEKDLEEQRKKHNFPDVLDKNNLAKDNPLLVRDLLGLATTQEWRLSYKFRVRHPKKEDKYYQENDILRMKSPILFKPIKITDTKFEIYIILNEINENIFNKKIKVLKTKDIGKGRDKREIIDQDLDFRFWNDFDLEKYFHFITYKVELDKHIAKDFIKHPYSHLIREIYKDLKANK